jgi:hypothetical protein
LRHIVIVDAGVDLGDGGGIVGCGHGEFGEFAQEGFAHGWGGVGFWLHEVGEQCGVLDVGEGESDTDENGAGSDAVDESDSERLEYLIDGEHGGGPVFNGREFDARIAGDAEALAELGATLVAIL